MKNRVAPKGIARIIIIAFIAFLVVAVAEIFLSIGLHAVQNQPDKAKITDWRFVWSDNQKDLEKEITKWKLSDQKIEIQKPFNKEYVRLNYTVDANDKDRKLELITMGNPIKVTLGGKQAYNNGYGTSAYTGNKLNVIDLPASGTETDLNIFMRAPLSFSIDGRIAPENSTLNILNFANQAGFAGGAAVFFLGIIMMLVSVVLSAGNKNFGKIIALSVSVISTGTMIMLSQIALHLPDFSNPIFYKLQLVLMMFTVTCVFGITLSFAGKISAAQKLCLTVSAVYFGLFAVISDQAATLWMIRVYPLMLLILTIVVAARLFECISAEMQYAKTAFFAFLLFAFTNIYDFLNLILGFEGGATPTRYIGMMFYAGIMFVIFIKQVIYVNVRLEEQNLQIEKDTVWINRVITSCANIFVQQNKNEFCLQTAGSIRDMIVDDITDRTTDENPADERYAGILMCVAIAEDGEFTEIFNDGISGCNYAGIAERNAKKGGKGVFFGNNYIDMTLMADGDLIAIIHFEGMSKGISENLSNIIHIAYSNISVAIANLRLKRDIAETQENVFINLSEIAERKHEKTGTHMRAVSRYVEVLCRYLNLPEHERDVISMASKVHDVGKLAIPETIIEKRGKLTEDEFSVMQEHVIYGYNILSKSPGEFMSAAAIIAQQHHERYDGTGYLGLRGEEINLYARITAIADVFDALMSERPYKRAWTFEETCKHINKQSGKHFDPAVVDAFNAASKELLEIKRSIKT